MSIVIKRIKEILQIITSKSFGFFTEKRTLFDDIKREKKINKDIKKILNKKSRSLWFSWSELIIVIIVFILFLILTHIQTFFPYNTVIEFIGSLYPFQGSPFALVQDNHYQNLIAIHAGIGAVLIGLAFFIAQLIAQERINGNVYKGFVILKRSKFFPILVAEILFFLPYLWGSVNILSIIPIILIGFFTLQSLYRTFDLMMNDFDLRKEEENIFEKEIRSYFLKVLDSDITKLVGDNRFKKRLEEFSRFAEFTPFSPLEKKNYFQIKTTKEGILKNIRYGSLKKFLSYLQKLAPVEKDELDVGSNTNTENTKDKPYLRKPYCYITPRFYSNLKDVDGILCWIRKDLITDKQKEIEVDKKARKMFVIGLPKFDLEEARNYIQKLKMLCLDLVRSQKTDELRRALGVYTKIIEDFYEYLKPFGGGFSEEQAKNMGMEIAFGGFKPIEWLAEDMREIFEQGIMSANREIVREVAYLPIRLLKYSIDYRDHLIFQQFQYYPHRLYQHAYKLKNSGNDELADFILDRSWRYLKELTDYYLEPKLKDEEYPEDEFKKFSISIIKIFQALLKASLDKRDIENFSTYLSTTLGLFRNLSITTRFGNKKAEDLNDYIQKRRNEMLFGLASWIFFQLGQGKNDTKLGQIFRDIKNEFPNDIVKFTEIFLNAHSFDAEHFWGWDNWEMEGREDGSVHTIQSLEKLERFYAIHSLILLESKTDEDIESISLPTNRDFAYLAEGTRDLTKTLDNIKNNPDNWRFALSDKAILKVDGLRGLLKKAKDVQDENDLQRKREAGISNEKIEKFKKSFLKNYIQSHPVKELFKKLNLFIDNTAEKAGSEIQKLGVNTLFDKAAFFGDDIAWHIHYTGSDEAFGFGRSMAYGENDQILEEISDKATEITENEFENTLANIKISNIVLIATNHAVWRFFEKANNSWIPKWHKEFPKNLSDQMIDGVFKFKNELISVYQLYTPNANHSDVFILDKSKIGKLIQYSPFEDKDTSNLLHDVFLTSIQEFVPDSDLVNEFLNKPPQWLSDVSTKDKQVEYLQERVLIRIFEKYEFKTHEKFYGYVLHTDKNIG